MQVMANEVAVGFGAAGDYLEMNVPCSSRCTSFSGGDPLPLVYVNGLAELSKGITAHSLTCNGASRRNSSNPENCRRVDQPASYRINKQPSPVSDRADGAERSEFAFRTRTRPPARVTVTAAPEVMRRGAF
jgi:hypothetical protein